MKYAIFDNFGFPKAFYSKDIHGDNIPVEAIEITDEQWQEFLNNQGYRRWDFIAGDVVAFDPKTMKIENGTIVEKTETELLNEQKVIRLRQVSKAFEDILANGHFFSQALQLEIDCRRNSTKNDLQNVENIIEFLTLTNGQGLDMYRGYTDPETCETQYAYNVTLSQLQQVKLEMIQYGLQLYNRKWQLEDAIANAQTQSELDAITIDFDNL